MLTHKIGPLSKYYESHFLGLWLCTCNPFPNRIAFNASH